MATNRHAKLTDLELHRPYRQIFADAAARLADSTVYTSDDLYKTAYQIDTQEVYTLTSIAPTWTLSSGGDGVWNLVSTAGPGYSAANTEFVVVTGASTIVTLPAPVLNARVAVKAAVVPVDIQVRTSGVGILIDGTDYSAVGLPLTTQWEQVSFISDGSNWFIF